MLSAEKLSDSYEILYEMDENRIVLSKQSEPYIDQKAREPLEDYLTLQNRYRKLINDPQALHDLNQQVIKQWEWISKRVSG